MLSLPVVFNLAILSATTASPKANRVLVFDISIPLSEKYFIVSSKSFLRKSTVGISTSPKELCGVLVSITGMVPNGCVLTLSVSGVAVTASFGISVTPLKSKLTSGCVLTLSVSGVAVTASFGISVTPLKSRLTSGCVLTLSVSGVAVTASFGISVTPLKSRLTSGCVVA